jgi:streptogramin lyase
VRVSHWRLDLLVILIGIVVAVNAHALYVRRPAHAAGWAAFGGAQALAAHEINRLSAGYTVYLADLWLDDPTIRFLAPRLEDARRIDAATTLPFRHDHSFAYFAPGHQEVVTEDLERVYEDGEIDRYRSPLDDSQVVLRSFRAPARVVAGVRGVTLRSTAIDRGRTNRYTLPTFELSWPVPGESSPSAVDLYTSLAVDTPGRYRFWLDGPPNSVLEINGVAVGRNGSELSASLAAGIQRVRVLATADRGSRIMLRWQPPGVSEPVPIPAEQLYREQRAASGLLAVYRAPGSDAGDAALLQVERYVQREGSTPPVARPHTLDLVGILDVPKSGTYRFRLAGSGSVGMWLDDQPVPLRRVADEAASLVLPEGDHRFRLRLEDVTAPTRLNLTWAPPNEDWGSIPTSRFRPPDGEAAAALAGVPADAGVPALGQPQVAWLASLQGEPRAVAAGPDGTVYVTNVTSRETQRIGSPGQPAVAVDGLSVSVPADVEVGEDGAVWVLDALDGQLRRSSPLTGQATPVGTRDPGFYRPRGFGLAPDGSVVVADTGGSRIARLAADGSLLATIGPDVGGPARLRQPTDVAVARNGDLFVINGEGGDVVRLTPDGRYVRHWTVLPADTERGAHIAIGPDDSVWISEPDGRRISRFTPTGIPAGVVDQTREGRLLRAPVGIAVGRDGTLYIADVSLRAVVAVVFR